MNKSLSRSGIRFIIIAMFLISFSILFLSAVKAKATVGEQEKYYKSIEVTDGVTLWNIAEEYCSNEYNDYNEYINEVKKLNHLGEDTIHSGQYIVIPYYSAVIEWFLVVFPSKNSYNFIWIYVRS